MSKVVELTKENFSEIIDGNDIVIVDFWAPWCGPCKSFAPTFETAAEKNKGIVFAKVNTEDEQALGGMFQIRSIPTLMVFKEQIVVFSQAGAMPASGLDELLTNANELDMKMVREEIAAKEEAEKATGTA
ncbi:MAG: thioredoxin 1 [Saprospiraceae bacterium]|jgi:thioredoxin 1